jgi:ketosteroid isomerase-like protein
MRPLLPCLLLVATTVSLAQPPRDDDAAVIEHQSKEFSDASASGDAQTLEKYLDDAVVFMNEGGEIATKHDIVTGTTPPPAGVHNTLVQTDFTIHIEGDVAVTSFTDNGTFNAYGQTYHGRFRSIEVWRRKQGHWLMISSQTLAASDDPPARQLPAAELDQYVGAYSAGPGLAVKITRDDGAGLVSVTNDGKPAALRVEVRDVLFTPGQPRLRRVFERDAAGKITGFVSRREGRDVLRFTRSG